jgi:chemotaxis protein MotB
MNLRLCLTTLACCGLFFVPGCATHYQELLRDRDVEIRELKAQLADARSENAELTRREQEARGRVAELESRATASEATRNTGQIDKLQNELGNEAEVRYKGGRISIGIENTVTFASGSTDLKSSANQILGRVADALKRDFASRRIFIEGHTDTDPINRTRDKYRDNRHLSVERADAVARYLIERCGIPERHVAVVGYGPWDPRQPGSNDQAKSKNRRVEIVVGEPM